MNTLEEKGFCIMRNFLSTNEAQECLTLVKYSINKASNEFGVTTKII